MTNQAHPWSPPPILLDPARLEKALQLSASLKTVISDNPELKEKAPGFIAALVEKSNALEQAVAQARELENEGVKVVFVAPKGAGKSSVLNGLLRTWVDPVGRPDSGESAAAFLQGNSVLPLGAGGTTPCEVRFEHSETWKVSVTSEEESRFMARVDALAGGALRNALVKVLGLSSDRGETEVEAEAEGKPPQNSEVLRLLAASPLLVSLPLEPDVRRCLIGVCDLRKGKIKGEAALDAAAQVALAPWKGQFAGQLTSDAAISALGILAEQFRDQLCLLAAYSGRRSFETHPPAGAHPMVWLKDLLQQLTWGSWPSQPFPARIEVQGPNFPRIASSSQRLGMVDSLGLRAVAKDSNEPPLKGCKDLDLLLRSQWAVAVYVAGFMNPPDPVTAAVTEGLFGSAPLSPPHRVIVPLLYKGEAILLDPLSSDSKLAQKEQEARNKRSACSDAINQLLKAKNKGQDWSDDFSPVIDLMGSLGGIGSMSCLEAAIEQRMVSMGLLWEHSIDQHLKDAAAMIKRAHDAPMVIEEVFAAVQERTKPYRVQVCLRLEKLKRNPVLPFAQACNSRKNNGYLGWQTVQSIARNQGDGTRNAFVLLRYDVVDENDEFMGSAIRDWRSALAEIQAELMHGVLEPLYQDIIKLAVNAEREIALSLVAAIGDAFEVAFRTVADDKVETSACLWEGLMRVRRGKVRPLGPAFAEAISRWGTTHQAELWAAVEAYLKEHDVELPCP